MQWEMMKNVISKYYLHCHNHTFVFQKVKNKRMEHKKKNKNRRYLIPFSVEFLISCNFSETAAHES